MAETPDELDRQLIDRWPLEFRRALLHEIKRREKAARAQQPFDTVLEVKLLLRKSDGKIEWGIFSRSGGW
jgi:hypothetical protein